jgi:hypothetical protein
VVHARWEDVVGAIGIAARNSAQTLESMSERKAPPAPSNLRASGPYAPIRLCGTVPHGEQ